ncbi:DUF4880 domain-containing protein [Rhodothermus marinus]|uniref:DUF4880 domain-containing protein n=1 Tax=Rhodothermus marinus TaxID=29549 RepID=UPI0006D0B7B6|nr:DUF4880 domain-containing protein [Rhodothermus marinus]
MAHTVSWQDLVDYLAGEASEAVQQRVEQWLEADAQHRALFRSLQQLWDAVAAPDEEDPAWLAAQWRALLEKNARPWPVPSGDARPES